MANRYSKLSTSTFSPLSMQEIMAVPMAMQQQHDRLQAEADKASLIEAQYGSADKEGAEARVAELRAKASDISSSLGDKGFNRSLLRDFTTLKKETELEYGKNGYLGKVQANAVAQGKFVNDLATDKVRQAGWSPQEAQQWAQRQVSEFGPTRNDDGTYNSFQGRELVTKFEGEDELLDKAIERVAEKIDPKTIAQIKVGGISGIERAFRERTILRKDYNTLMDSMMTSAATNPDLLRSLTQEAELYGLDNPLDFGSFNIVNTPRVDGNGDPVLDKNGTQVIDSAREFTPGQSRFGQKMSGFGIAAQYVNPTDAIKINTDPTAKALFDAGMTPGNSSMIVSIGKGQLTMQTAEELGNARDLVGEALNQSKIFKIQADTLYDKLLKNGATPEQIKDDKEWQRLNSQYVKSNAIYSNAKQRIDNVTKKADADLTNNQKNRIKFQEKITAYSGPNYVNERGIINFERILLEEYGETITTYGKTSKNGYMKLLKQGDHDPKDVANNMFHTQSGRNKKALQILEQKFGLRNSVTSAAIALTGAGNHSFDREGRNLKKIRDAKTQQYLTANPTADYFNIFDGNSSGKGYSIVGDQNKVMTDSFSPGAAQLNRGGGRLLDNEEYQDLMDDLPEGEVPEISVSLTDGQDDDGTFFNNVIVTTSNGTGSFQVIDPSNNGTRRQIFEAFVNGGNSDQVAIGTQGLANLDHMSNILQSGFGKQPDGVVTMKNGNTNYEATYKQDDTGQFYVVTIPGADGKPISISDQPIYSKADLSLKMAQAVQEINDQIQKESDPNYDASTDTTIKTKDVSPSVLDLVSKIESGQGSDDNAVVSMEDVSFYKNISTSLDTVVKVGANGLITMEDPVLTAKQREVQATQDEFAEAYARDKWNESVANGTAVYNEENAKFYMGTPYEDTQDPVVDNNVVESTDPQVEEKFKATKQINTEEASSTEEGSGATDNATEIEEGRTEFTKKEISDDVQVDSSAAIPEEVLTTEDRTENLSNSFVNKPTGELTEVEKDTSNLIDVDASNKGVPVIPTEIQIDNQSTEKTAIQNVKVITSPKTSVVETKKAVENVATIIDEVPPSDKLKVITAVMENEKAALRTNPLAFANKYLGLNENATEDQEAVMGFLNSALPGFIKNKANVTLNSSAWCAAFVHSILVESGYKPLEISKSKAERVRALDYARIGTGVDGGIKNAKPGNVVVIRSKKSGRHHVGFHSGFTNNGIPLMFGGNQSDLVSIKEINLGFYDVVGVRDLGAVTDMSEEDLKIINGTKFYNKFRGSTSERTL